MQLGSQNDVEMCHDPSWKAFIFGVKMSKLQVTKILPAWVFGTLCTLVSAGFFQLIVGSCVVY